MSELSSRVRLIGDEGALSASLAKLLKSPESQHICELSIRARGHVDEGCLWPLVERPLQALRMLSLSGLGGRILDALLSAHPKLERLESIGDGPAPFHTGKLHTLALGRTDPRFVRSLRLAQNPAIQRLALRCPSAEISLEPVLDAVERYAPNLEHLSLTFFGWARGAGRLLRPRELWSRLRTLELSGSVMVPSQKPLITRAFARNFDWLVESPQLALAGLGERRRSAGWLGDRARMIEYAELERRLGEVLGVSTEEAELDCAAALLALSRGPEAVDWLVRCGASESTEGRVMLAEARRVGGRGGDLEGVDGGGAGEFSEGFWSFC